MKLDSVSGQRQTDFLTQFDYIREAGTEGEKRAAYAIRKELESFGAESRLEPFFFETYKIKNACLTVTEPYRKDYRVTGYGRCGSTPEEGVERAFLYVENGDEISLAGGKDKIVMVNGPVRKELYGKLTAAGAAGFVSVTGTPIDRDEDLIPGSYSLPQMWETPIQGVNLHYNDAVEIVTKGASRARLMLEQEYVERESGNVTARLEGRDKAEEILTLTAHYDSVPDGPGAYDNMAGAAIIMELCRYFKAHQPRRTMEFVWLGAEEKGLIGSRRYVELHQDELLKHRFNMNVDLAGQLVGGNVIGVTGETSVCEVLTELAREIGLGMTVKNQIWGSDSNTFAWKGIPAMTLNRDGFGMHTRHDVTALLSSWSLQRSAALLGHIAESLGNMEKLPFARSVPEEFKRQLDEYFADKK